MLTTDVTFYLTFCDSKNVQCFKLLNCDNFMLILEHAEKEKNRSLYMKDMDHIDR